MIAGLAIFPFTPLPAIEPPPDNSKPPAALLREEEIEFEADVKLPFVGLSTANVPEMVADHLGIDGGTGVIIRTVCPDSPGKKAGLTVNDIILSIDGTPVLSSDDFSEKIRARKPGDTLELALIRKGKPNKVEITLTERPADLNTDQSPEPFMQSLPEGQADRLRDMMERNLQGFGMEPLGISPNQQLENTFRMMREQMNRAFENQIPPITQGEDGEIRFQQDSTISLMDNEGSVEMKSSDADTHVTVRDTARNIVWEGPWNSEKDKEAAPDDIRKRIERFNIDSANGRGFTLRFGQPGTTDN